MSGFAEGILLSHCVTPKWGQTRASLPFWAPSQDPSPWPPPSSPFLAFLTVQVAPAASYQLAGRQAQLLPLASLWQRLVLLVVEQAQELNSERT